MTERSIPSSRTLLVGLSALLLGLLATTLGGCPDDGLGTVVPGADLDGAADTDPGGPDPYPVAVGAEFSFTFSRQYTPDFADFPIGGGSATVNEVKSFGQLCLRVVQVEDNLPQVEPSTLAVDIRVSGQTVGSDIGYERVDANGDPDPLVTDVEVDAATDPLWLWRMTFPTRGYLEPNGEVLSTRGPLHPGGGLTSLLFFDPRPSGAWEGWSDPGVQTDPESIVTEVRRYLDETVGVDIADPTQFRLQATELRPSCFTPEDETACIATACFWNVSAARCEPPNATLSVVFRETWGDGPAELVGPVLHSLTFEFTFDGVLASAEEYVIAEPNGGLGNLTAFANCSPTAPAPYTQGPCASALLHRRSTPFATAACAFAP